MGGGGRALGIAVAAITLAAGPVKWQTLSPEPVLPKYVQDAVAMFWYASVEVVTHEHRDNLLKDDDTPSSWQASSLVNLPVQFPKTKMGLFLYMLSDDRTENYDALFGVGKNPTNLDKVSNEYKKDTEYLSQVGMADYTRYDKPNQGSPFLFRLNQDSPHYFCKSALRNLLFLGPISGVTVYTTPSGGLMAQFGPRVASIQEDCPVHKEIILDSVARRRRAISETPETVDTSFSLSACVLVVVSSVVLIGCHLINHSVGIAASAVAVALSLSLLAISNGRTEVHALAALRQVYSFKPVVLAATVQVIHPDFDLDAFTDDEDSTYQGALEQFVDPSPASYVDKTNYDPVTLAAAIVTILVAVGHAALAIYSIRAHKPKTGFLLG